MFDKLIPLPSLYFTTRTVVQLKDPVKLLLQLTLIVHGNLLCHSNLLPTLLISCYIPIWDMSLPICQQLFAPMLVCCACTRFPFALSECKCALIFYSTEGKDFSFYNVNGFPQKEKAILCQSLGLS